MWHWWVSEEEEDCSGKYFLPAKYLGENLGLFLQSVSIALYYADTFIKILGLERCGHTPLLLCISTLPQSMSLFLSLVLLSYICELPMCPAQLLCSDGKTRWVALSKAGRLSLVRVGQERLQVRIFQVNQDGDDNQYDELETIYLFFAMLLFCHLINEENNLCRWWETS